MEKNWAIRGLEHFRSKPYSTDVVDVFERLWDKVDPTVAVQFVRLYCRRHPDGQQFDSYLRRADWLVRGRYQRGRTRAKFEADIKFHSDKEAMLMAEFQRSLERRGQSLDYSDYGIDNSGEHAVDHTGIQNPDYRIVKDGVETLADIKAYGSERLILKVGELIGLQQHGASLIYCLNVRPNTTIEDWRFLVVGPNWLADLAKTPVSTGSQHKGGKPVHQIDNPYRITRVYEFNGTDPVVIDNESWFGLPTRNFYDS